MPNYYTHLTFGAKVLEGLPHALKTCMAQERPAFDVGCLGPDPLFFRRPVTRNPARMEGIFMHRNSALPVFIRLRAAVEEGLPMSKGYTAGFLCHLALDSACHGWIDRRAAEGEVTHLAIEAEFDRLLMTRDGRKIRNGSQMSPPPGQMVWTAAARAYENVSPREMEQGYRAMRRDTAILARLGGTRLGRLADWCTRRIPVLAGAKGVVLDKTAPVAFVESNRYLEERMGRAVVPTIEQIARFFEAVDTGEPLDPWLDRDFGGSGEAPGEWPAPNCPSGH